MNKPLTTSLLGAIALTATHAGALAGPLELARVVSTTPVMQQVALPQQVCTHSEAVVTRSTGTGAAIGAIAGGALGASAHGSARLPATVIGALGGAVLGDRIEQGNRTATVQNCVTQTTYENRAVAYNVVYEYAGRQYTTTLREDPGTTLPVEVTPAGAIQGPPPVSTAPPAPTAPLAAPPAVATTPLAAPVVIAQSAPYTVYAPPLYPPPVVSPPTVIYSRPYYIDPIYPATALGVTVWGGYRYGHPYHHGWRGHRRWH